MKKGVCYIVGAGEVGRLSITLTPGDYLVAADGGLEKLRAHGLEPDLVLVMYTAGSTALDELFRFFPSDAPLPSYEETPPVVEKPPLGGS